MLERGLQFTRRRSRTSQRRLINPYPCEVLSATAPDEAGNKSVDFA